jgi:hypothetical protein
LPLKHAIRDILPHLASLIGLASPIIFLARVGDENRWVQEARMEDTCRKKAPPSEGDLSEGPPATHGPRHKSLMVRVDAGEWVVVGRGVPGVPNQCTKTEGKINGC